MRILILCLLGFSSNLWAHLDWVTPAHRLNENIKQGPCGGIAAGGLNVRTQYVAGEVFEVEFDEYINHEGYYKIFFAPQGDNNFQELVMIVDNTDALKVKYNLTMPNEPCDNCTLQIIQYMVNGGNVSLYYSCADIRILPAGSPLPDPDPAPVEEGGTTCQAHAH